MKQANNNDRKEKLAFLYNFGLGEERDFFIENLSSLLSSGIPIVSAINAINEEMRSRRLKRITNNLAQDIDSGRSLSESLERTGLFSPHVYSLIRIGEKSGRLVENLKVIASEEKKERVLKSKLRSAAMYPLFVLVLTLFIGIGIAWFILPKLATVFSQLKVKLPVVTKILIDFGLFLGQYGIYAVPIFIIVFVLLIYLIFSFSKTKLIGEFIIFRFPGLKDLVKQSEIARLGYLLGALISTGLSPMESLDSLAKASMFSRYRRFYTFLSDSVTEGNSFKKSFALYKKTNSLLPVTVQQLIIAGEQSGNLPETLSRIGEEYEAKTDSSTKDLMVVLEPILLVIVWLGVVAVALAVILPIYSLIGGLQTGY
ncbi:MAG: type II secretion system F family protein [Candidatus Falkowbacteria bacterium]|nr:type II secretion system F family protein [Candidatus Falkowbacteria bacterium]